MCNPVGFSIFTPLCNHYLYLLPEHFHHHKKKPDTSPPQSPPPALPSPWQPLVCFLSSCIWLFRTFCFLAVVCFELLLYSGIIQRVASVFGFPHLAEGFRGPSPTVVCVSPSFLPVRNNCSIVRTDHILSVRSSVFTLRYYKSCCYTSFAVNIGV